MKKKTYKKYGTCFKCGRWLWVECLEQVEEYSDSHIVPGGFHHKLACITCRAKADEASIQMLEENKDYDEKTYNGVSVSQLKVGGTD